MPSPVVIAEHHHVTLHRVVEVGELRRGDQMERGADARVPQERLNLGGHRAVWREDRVELAAAPHEVVRHGNHDLARETLGVLLDGRDRRAGLDREHDHVGVARPRVVARRETGDAGPPLRDQRVDRALRPLDRTRAEENLVTDAREPRREAAARGSRRAQDADAHPCHAMPRTSPWSSVSNRHRDP